MSSAGADNVNFDPDNNVFTVKDAKFYLPLVTLSAKDNQNLSKRLSQRFQRSVYWNEYKTKNHNKYTTNEYRYFLEPNFVGFNRLFALVYVNQHANAKIPKAQKYCLPKDIIKSYNIIINEKNFMTSQSIPDISENYPRY